jgi:hypothetical protein
MISHSDHDIPYDVMYDVEYISSDVLPQLMQGSPDLVYWTVESMAVRYATSSLEWKKQLAHMQLLAHTAV